MATAQMRVNNGLEFEDLLREHQRMVFSIAYHMLHDRSAAEEVAQDVFLHLYKNLGSLQSGEHVANWLRRVTAHRAIDYARRHRDDPQVALQDVPEPARAAEIHDPLLADRLRQLVASLPPNMRAVVVLRYQEELELHDIAKLLNTPVNTVKSQLHRALSTLREKVGRSIGEDSV